MKNKGIKAIAKVEAELKAFNQDLKSREYMKELGEFVAGIIQRNSGQRSGSLAGGSEKRTPYKKLSASYVEQRKKDKAEGKLASSAPFVTSPTTSNITRTGQLRKSIKPKRITNSTVTVGPAGMRDDGKSNEKIGEYVTEGGRPFMGISDQERKQVANKIVRDLKAFMRKRLK